MNRLLALLALGALAPMLQGAASTFLPARFCPDLGLLFVVAIGLSWRSTAGGLVLAALCGYVTDLLSGALLGQHAMARMLFFGAARSASRHLNLRGPLPQAAFAAVLTAANALALGGLTAFFASGSAPPAIALRELLPQVLVNAALAPAVGRGVERLLQWLGEEEGGRRGLRLGSRSFSA